MQNKIHHPTMYDDIFLHHTSFRFNMNYKRINFARYDVNKFISYSIIETVFAAFMTDIKASFIPCSVMALIEKTLAISALS